MIAVAQLLGVGAALLKYRGAFKASSCFKAWQRLELTCEFLLQTVRVWTLEPADDQKSFKCVSKIIIPCHTKFTKDKSSVAREFFRESVVRFLD